MTHSSAHTDPFLLGTTLDALGVADEGILVGISGGADSVALLRAMHRLIKHPGDRLIIAHLDHGLRDDSASDADWVRQLAADLGLPAVIDRVDVTQRAADDGIGMEAAARRCRYEFLQHTAERHRCRFITVAHTADDQAETILHHLLRGTGLAGLRGMPAARELSEGVTLIRPLLGVSRDQVVTYLAEIGQSFREDLSNTDEQFTRNRIRHTLLPLLQDEFNPQVIDALNRLGEQARDVQLVIEQLAADMLASAVTLREPIRITLDAARLVDVPRHVLREAFRLLFTQQDWPRQRMGADDWNRLADLAQLPQSSQPPKSLTLPHGTTAHWRRGQLRIER